MSILPTSAGRNRRPLRRSLYGGLTVILGLTGVSGVTALTAGTASAGPPSISGYATNFDVPNGTDKECEGFEVDIEDVTPSQITYTWPGTVSYPNPFGPATPAEIQGKVFPDGHSGVSVTFKASYSGGAWSAYTPIGQVNHFGVHVTGAPGVRPTPGCVTRVATARVRPASSSPTADPRLATSTPSRAFRRSSRQSCPRPPVRASPRRLSRPKCRLQQRHDCPMPSSSRSTVP